MFGIQASRVFVCGRKRLHHFVGMFVDRNVASSQSSDIADEFLVFRGHSPPIPVTKPFSGWRRHRALTSSLGSIFTFAPMICAAI
jgi:hypothetical protein